MWYRPYWTSTIAVGLEIGYCVYILGEEKHTVQIKVLKKQTNQREKGPYLKPQLKYNKKKDNNCNTILMKMLTKRFVATEINKRKWERKKVLPWRCLAVSRELVCAFFLALFESWLSWLVGSRTVCYGQYIHTHD